MLVQGPTRKENDRELCVTFWYQQISRRTIIPVYRYITCGIEAVKKKKSFPAYIHTNDMLTADSSSNEVLVWFTYQ